jgi:hypothetical protein
MENSGGSVVFGAMSVLLTAAGLVAIYFLYDFLYSGSSSNMTVLVPNRHTATEMVKDPAKVPPIFEGGEYSFSTWVYISSYMRNQNKVKHIFQLKGDHFSTLLVGLGGSRNSVVVRVHTADVADNFQGAPNKPTEGFYTTTTVAETPDLGGEQVEALFAAMADTTSSSSDVQPMCDLAEIDLQRWVHLAVVISGRTIDVYLDGKLARSCVANSYFKADPTGVKAVICDKGGFDGYITGLSVANYSMNPGEIYRTYISGPEGTTNNALKWFGSLFTGA